MDNLQNLSSRKETQIPAWNKVLEIYQTYFLNRTDKVLAIKANGEYKALSGSPDELNGWIQQHVYGLDPKGIRTLGSYAISSQDTCKWCCIDIDSGSNHSAPLQEPERILKQLVELCNFLYLDAYVEKSKSGSGYHLWIFFTTPIPAQEAKALGYRLCQQAHLQQNGEPILPNNQQGLEVFPKSDRLNGKGYGTGVNLPWSHAGQNGGSLFCVFSAEGELQLIQEPIYEFVTVDHCQVQDLLADFSSEAIHEDSLKKGYDPAPSTPSGTSTFLQECAPFVANLDLNLVYEKYLTGGRSGENWLVCRDPWSPTGDRNPSAAVCTGATDCLKGTFKSFRDDTTLPVWEFMVKDGQCESREEALKQISEWTHQPIPAYLQMTPQVESIIEEFNQEFAIVVLGDKTVIAWEHLDEYEKEALTFLDFKDFRNLKKNIKHKIKLDKNHYKEVCAVDYWLEHPQRRQYLKVIFDPCCQNPKFYNLWKGYYIQPQPGNCSLYLQHIQNVICNGDPTLYRYVLSWLADLVQNPNNKPGVAIVLKGNEGVGKGTFVQPLEKLYGPHFKQISNSQQLVGKFNDHLKDCLVLFADEAYYAGDKASEGVLKALITEPFLMIEPKGKNAIRMTNKLRIIMASNNDWVIPAHEGARRFLVLNVSDAHRNDHAYFQAIQNELNQGGYEALLHFLQNYDLSGVNLRDVPQTDALLEQKLLTLDSVELFWYERLQEGRLLPSHDQWEEFVPANQLYKHYLLFEKRRGIQRRKSDSEFGRIMKKVCPSNIKKLQRLVVEGKSQRSNCYLFPTLLECREEFDVFLNTKIAWNPILAEKPTLQICN